MDTSKAAARRIKINTTLKDLKSRQDLNDKEKDLLKLLSPFEKANDEKILKISDLQWAAVFPGTEESPVEPGKYSI
jgi:hypothetical protein